MRVARLGLAAFGVAGVLWGVWLLSDEGVERLRSVVLWLAGVVVLHDALLAPAVVLLGVLAARTLPGRARPVVAVTFVVWGTLTVAVMNVLSGRGGKPGMDSLLNRPYLASWLVLTAVLWAAAIALVVIRRGADRGASA